MMSNKGEKQAGDEADWEVKAAEYLEGWQRARAEFDNYRKQREGEAQINQRRAREAVVMQLLPVFDNFASVTAHVPDELSENTWVAGVLHVARQAGSALEELGVQIMQPVGSQFDPHYHEAVEEVREDGAADGEVVAEVGRGYELDGVVLKPARVKVNRIEPGDA